MYPNAVLYSWLDEFETWTYCNRLCLFILFVNMWEGL